MPSVKCETETGKKLAGKRDVISKKKRAYVWEEEDETYQVQERCRKDSEQFQNKEIIWNEYHGMDGFENVHCVCVCGCVWGCVCVCVCVKPEKITLGKKRAITTLYIYLKNQTIFLCLRRSRKPKEIHGFKKCSYFRAKIQQQEKLQKCLTQKQSRVHLCVRALDENEIPRRVKEKKKKFIIWLNIGLLMLSLKVENKKSLMWKCVCVCVQEKRKETKKKIFYKRTCEWGGFCINADAQTWTFRANGPVMWKCVCVRVCGKKERKTNRKYYTCEWGEFLH